MSPCTVPTTPATPISPGSSKPAVSDPTPVTNRLMAADSLNPHMSTNNTTDNPQGPNGCNSPDDSHGPYKPVQVKQELDFWHRTFNVIPNQNMRVVLTVTPQIRRQLLFQAS